MAANNASREIHVLILNDDEYIFWVACFEDKADAEFASKLANAGLREDSGHSFYVSSYAMYPKGSIPSIGQIKAASSDDHDCDEMWALTVEERLDGVNEFEVVREIAKRAEESPGFVRAMTETEFRGLHAERRVVIADWVDDLHSDYLTSLPAELRPDGQRPVIPAPGQQELPIQ